MGERSAISLVTSGGIEAMPLVLLRGWRQWHIAPDGLRETPMSCAHSDWLDPRHTDELWFAQGLPIPELEVGLQFLIKAGELRCIMPSLDTRLVIEGVPYRNRGLRTLALAHTWVNFAGLQLGLLKLSGFFRPLDDTAWQPWFTPKSLNRGLASLVPILAEGPDELRQGFHLLSVPMLVPDQALQADYEYVLLLSGGEDRSQELLALEKPPCSCLRIKTSNAARLSESYTKPLCYQPLIDAESDDD